MLSIVFIIILILPHIHADILFLKNDNILEGSITKKSDKNIYFKCLKIKIHKNNIQHKIHKKALLNKGFGILFLKSNVKLKGDLKKLANGDVLISKNSYLPDDYIYKSEEIEKIRIFPIVEVQLKQGLTYRGSFVKQEKYFVFLENLIKPQNEIFISKSSIVKMNSVKADSSIFTEDTTAKQSKTRNNFRLSLLTYYAQTFGSLKNIFPIGWGHFLAIEQSFDTSTSTKSTANDIRNVWFPGFRLEFGYIQFDSLLAQIAGFQFGIGPLWLIPFLENHKGQFVTSFLVSLSFLSLRDESFETNIMSWSLQGILGYEYNWQNFGLFFHTRLTYIFDSKDPLIAFGAAIGALYNIEF